MRIREVFEKTMRSELSVAEAAEITGVAERDVVAWMRARRAGRGGLDEHRRKRLKGAASTQVQYAVALYRERYTSLSASEFARVLKSEHGIVLRGPGLYLALRKEGLIAPRPVKAWRLAAAGITPYLEAPPTASPSEVVVAAHAPPPMDPLQRIGRELQVLTDRVDRLNAQARDRIVDWRRGAGTIESALSAVTALKEFITGLPK
jgi:transposase